MFLATVNRCLRGGTTVSKIVLQVRRGDKLLGSWSLQGEPLSFSLTDEDTGRELAVFQAQAPRSVDGSGIEEETLVRSSPPRILSDDFTMPAPEFTEERMTTESNPLLRSAGDDLTMPMPSLLTDTSPNIDGAEIWRRVKQSWQVVGRLPPGHQLTIFGGALSLHRDGAVVLQVGEEMSGSATLPDGQVVPIQPDSGQLKLPPGVSIMLRSGEDGLYIRSVMIDG